MYKRPTVKSFQLQLTVLSGRPGYVAPSPIRGEDSVRLPSGHEGMASPPPGALAHMIHWSLRSRVTVSESIVPCSAVGHFATLSSSAYLLDVLPPLLLPPPPLPAAPGRVEWPRRDRWASCHQQPPGSSRILRIILRWSRLVSAIQDSRRAMRHLPHHVSASVTPAGQCTVRTVVRNFWFRDGVEPQQNRTRLQPKISIGPYCRLDEKNAT